MTIEEFQRRYDALVPQDGCPKYAYEVEIFISHDGCMEVRYGVDFIPELTGDNWTEVLTKALAFIRDNPLWPAIAEQRHLPPRT